MADEKPVHAASDEPSASAVPYFLEQLKFAHRRNDIVEDLRFKVLQTFFIFQGLVISATLFAGNKLLEVRAELGAAASVVPILIVFVGLTLFTIFLRWHSYLYRYKGWIANLDDWLRHHLFMTQRERIPLDYTGTYYHDENKKLHSLEAIGILTAIAMATVNLGFGALLLHLLNSHAMMRYGVVACGALAHVLVALWTFSRP